MLTLQLNCDDANKLSSELDINIDGVKVYLFDNDSPIGIAVLKFGVVTELADMQILPKYNTLYNRQFLFRGVLYKLGITNQKLRIKTDDEVLLSYGFSKDGEYMIINCSEANYPSSCGHK